jgi:hypothetical protein
MVQLGHLLTQLLHTMRLLLPLFVDINVILVILGIQVLVIKIVLQQQVMDIQFQQQIDEL